ncbi:PEGA domain-containing protein, partial [bacterium]
MKTQIVTDRAMRSQVVARVVAGAMAGVLTFAGTAGFGGGVAYAQAKKPAAAAPAPAPAKKGAKPDPKDKDPELKRARDAYANGEAKFKAGDFATALTEFQVADSVKPSSQAARYIGLCQDNLGKFPDAVVSYERFLAAVPPKLQKEGDEIRKRVEEIKAMPARLHVVTVPAGAAISVDGKPANAAAPTDIELSPGAHKLAFTSDGYLTQEKDVEARYAAHEDLNVTLEKAPEPT